MAAAFETIDTDGITADGLRLQRVADRGAFVDDLNPGFLEHRQPFLRVIAGCFDNLHAAIDDRLDVARVIGGIDARQKAYIHAERLVCHLTATTDLIGQKRRRALRQPGNDPEAAGIGDGGR